MSGYFFFVWMIFICPFRLDLFPRIHIADPLFQTGQQSCMIVFLMLRCICIRVDRMDNGSGCDQLIGILSFVLYGLLFQELPDHPEYNIGASGQGHAVGIACIDVQFCKVAGFNEAVCISDAAIPKRICSGDKDHGRW
ncbi:hypothetical protein QE441_000052 [Chryseobacterium sp. SORGH_AS909]|uniref:Uncharacterized protein n=1 Tax=Chryseobacterium camelliae TaxID=1265445 RepID=A0ABU0TKP9_9FLAO|nr:hypothetical protein [Chryseobacterium camelliae]MDQ1100817.1 hypothetical protein [Chryseobacterium sp. SORGH_AS_1048]MDR6084258.1 hypothetical protein [Chryseobacterium sp. SORGH_AS_0909]MDT3409263.1 hypothetical protein [Pseudacidovorax intermedius]